MKLVGIFSKDDPGTYKEMRKFLAKFSTVKPVPMSNNTQENYTNKIFGCSVAVLYHSNGENVNDTGLPNGLLHGELEYYSSVLGKENVIVVIDNVTDSGDAEKIRILEHQPKISRLAQDLFLFTRNEIEDEESKAAKTKRKKIKMIIDQSCCEYLWSCEYCHLTKKEWIISGVVIIFISVLILIFILKVMCFF
ncbi:uncharacterized protein O3C94_018197 [Discoglossus pictus]